MARLKLFSSALLAVLTLLYMPATRALEEPADDEVQIPEGFEERHYSLYSLTERPKNFTGGGAFEPSQVASLTAENVVEILRTAVAPESWTKHGSARIEVKAGVLSVMQKKEQLVEVEKVLNWLQESAAPVFKATVIVATLKPETLKKLRAAETIAPADLGKALEAAGESGVQAIQLHGVEGQLVVARGGFGQRIVRDFDVSGAVYDPVMASVHSELLATAVAYRNPDCSSLQIDLSVSEFGPPEMGSAKLTLDGARASGGTEHIKKVTVDDKGKAKEEGEIKVPKAGGPSAEFSGNLVMDLPRRTVGSLETSLSAPHGAFVLAGIVDDSAAGGAPGSARAVFIRATIGSGSIPVLTGVTGLKEGESFRLYPITATRRTPPEFKTTLENFFDINPMEPPVAVGTSGGTNAFSAPTAGATPQVPRMAESMSKAQHMFAEHVRKNRIIEEMGPVGFTRLNDADHAKMLKTMMDEVHFNFAPATIQLRAVLLPPAAYRSVLIADKQNWDLAELDALSAGGSVLAESLARVTPGQAAAVIAESRRSVVSGYEISGDSYDPIVREFTEQGFSASFKFLRGVQAGGQQLEIRFQAAPAKAIAERSVIDTFTLSSGADASVVLGLHADLDKVKSATIAVRGTAILSVGKFVLAGAAPLRATPDGKPDARQMLLFVRAD